MDVVRGLMAPLPALRAPVATLGGFDGVHRGHQRIVGDTVAWARAVGGEAVAITFDPLPKQVVGPGGARCITSLAHRLLLLGRCGVDVAVVLAFDEGVKRLAAEAFVERVLVGWLGARRVVVGRDARFGHGGRGDLALLERMAEAGVLEVCSPEPVRYGGQVISSTAIREAVAEGDLVTAAAMLGRPYGLLGTVVPGHGRGRDLGFPTANLDLHHEALPPHGVYATALALDDRSLPALTYIGTRPTFADDAQPSVEVYIIDLDDRDLYGRQLEVVFVQRLRGDRRFPDRDALIAQMEADREAARALFRDRPPPHPLGSRPSSQP
ncbi:MAG: riboflavin biosynthesis protein RibF [Planctomycetota bacterium]